MKRLLILILFTGMQNAWAATEEVRTESPKVERQWGGYVGLGNPYPTLLGLNLAWNATPHIRATAGYGEIEVTTSVSFSSSGFVEEKTKAQTYAVGADYLFMDGSLRPLIGAKVGYFDISGKGEFEVQGIDKSTGLLYGNLGVDWIASSGLNVGAGFNVSVLGGSGANFYANLGYFY